VERKNKRQICPFMLVSYQPHAQVSSKLDESLVPKELMHTFTYRRIFIIFSTGKAYHLFGTSKFVVLRVA
jgi:hypothetical protein